MIWETLSNFTFFLIPLGFAILQLAFECLLPAPNFPPPAPFN